MLSRASYDGSYVISRFTQKPETQDVVIVYVDANCLAELGQSSSQPMDRSLHARLLRRLKADEAKATVMDIVFNGPGPRHEADEELAAAIRGNCRGILAQDANEGGGEN